MCTLVYMSVEIVQHRTCPVESLLTGNGGLADSRKEIFPDT